MWLMEKNNILPASMLSFNACDKTYSYMYIVHKQGAFVPCVASGRRVMVSPLRFPAWWGFSFDLLSGGCI